MVLSGFFVVLKKLSLLLNFLKVSTKLSRKRAPRPVKYFGNDYEGRVTFVTSQKSFYGGVIYKVYFVTEDDKKYRFWSNTAPCKGETITVNGVEDEVYNDCTLLKKAKIVK